MSFINKIGKIFGTSSSAPAASASRSVAKERLSVILAAQRGTHLLEGVDVEALQRDVMEVVQVRMNVSMYFKVFLFACNAADPPFPLPLTRDIFGQQRPARRASTSRVRESANYLKCLSKLPTKEIPFADHNEDARIWQVMER